MDIIWLNVGGVYHVTSRTTLLQNDNAFFAGMMRSDPHAHEFFVDRDPHHFRYVLNWLRGSRCLPDDALSLREIEAEADFYNMGDLVEATRKRKHVYGNTLTDRMGDILRTLRQMAASSS